jgi:hypothetical protein
MEDASQGQHQDGPGQDRRDFPAFFMEKDFHQKQKQGPPADDPKGQKGGQFHGQRIHSNLISPRRREGRGERI